MPVRAHLLLAAALLSGTLLPLAAPAVADTGPVPLGLSRSADVVVDEAHGRVFVSGGPSGPGVVVTDLAGTPVTTLQHTGATGMALSGDGSRLWVALPQMGLVSIDTATLAPDKRFPLPTGVCAGDVAVVGDRLAYGYSCNRYLPSGGGYGGVGVVDAVTGASYGTVTSGPFYEPRVATGPAGQVYAADAGLSPTALHLYDVGGSNPVGVASRAGVCSNLRDLSPSRDGADVVLSCGSPYEHTTYSGVQKLELGPRYPTGAYPVAGAWSADGQVFAAGTDAPYGTDVRAFPAGATTPSWVRDFATSTAVLQPRGLALSADGTRAWAVVRGSSGGLDLRVLGAPSRDATSLTLGADPPVVYVGEGTSMGGWLSWGGVGIGGVALTVTRAATGATPVPLPAVMTRADGTYVFTDAPTEPGSYTYTVGWPGDATRGGAQATTTVRVNPLGTSLQLFLDRADATPTTVEGTVLLRHSDPEVTLARRTVRLARAAAGAWTDLDPVTTDEWGVARFTDVPPLGSVSYTASVDPLGGSPAVSTTATVEVALTPTTLTAKAPTSSTVGSPIALSGVLSSPAGAVTGATVSVVRTGCGPDWTGTSTTTPNGAWSVTDPSPPAGSCSYGAAYAGDDRYAASGASTSTTVSLVATALTVATPATADVGAVIPVRGVLSSGGAAFAGADITVTRSGCSDSGWSAQTVTAGDGSWSVSDTSPPLGSCTYLASYGGDGRYAAVDASATTSVVKRTSVVSVTAARGTGAAKKTVTITGKLGAWYTNRTLTMTAQTSGGAEVVIASGPVDATGTLTTTHTPKTTTTYRVRYDGDGWYLPGSAQQVL